MSMAMVGLLVLGAGGLFACGSKSTGESNNNSITWCEDDNQCGPGEVCRGNQCVVEGDGGLPDSTVDEPDIVLSDETLDFESPLIGAEVILPLTVHNVGTADLVITLIEIIETGGPGSPQEFHSDFEGAVNIVIPPNGEQGINVSLLSVDGELDLGELRIHSNDPDENPVGVDLVSEHKGVADIDVCATDEGTALVPEAPYLTYPYDATDCVVSVDDDPVLDFGLVQFEEPQRRILALYNLAEGNAPLTINSVLITNNSGQAASFSMSFWVQDESTGEATSVGLPFFLSAGDTVNGINPTVVYVSVDFDASVDVFPLEQLEIQTNDPDESQVFVDIVGVVTGCPPDFWDVNGDPSDGCEYSCEFLGSTEDCLTPGEDDNCNGEVDEEDADNCTVYYRDHDGDGFGDGNDARCLCAADGEYNVGQGGDCDDDDEYVLPGVVERCITPYDDNCDGSDNDPDAQGCVSYLRDEDGDGYGITGDTECLCYNAGFYTASMGGDCDDDPNVCGVGCNPGMAEQCSTAYDDNCNGDSNELNAPGCTTYYRDSDDDGYGHQSISQCWCSPNGDFDSTDPSDCDDGNDAINPAASEECDLVDNNCVAGIDEGFDLQTDTLHCGVCNHACTNAHGAVACIAGVCSPTCAPGWGDCDTNPDNGCETDLNVVSFCGACLVNAECPNGFFCDGGTCTKKWNDGHTCSDDFECSSSLCRDLVCCNSDCSGICRGCAVMGSVGTCTYYAADTDPEPECTQDLAATCGQTGWCDGGGACQLYSAGTECLAESCTGTSHLFADTCNGAGGCQDGGSEDCSPYVCLGTSCRTSCTITSHCVAGFICTGNACVPQSGIGDSCSNDGECATGHCEDSVCCNRECDGTCRACNLGGNIGTCIDHASGEDPETGCGLCRACDGSGACAPATSGDDPKDQCSPQAKSTCGRDGECDGLGACRLWAIGTQCVAQSCVNHTVSLPRTCNGSGTCLTGTSLFCTPYECSGSVCGSSPCGSDTDCISGYFCNASNICVTKMGLGQVCGGLNECISGICKDGVCCGTPCTGTCESCNLSGSAGTCTDYDANDDPEHECTGTCRSCNGSGSCYNTAAGFDEENECTPSASSSCGTLADCDGAGDCAYWAPGTQCVAQSCAGSIEYPADFCNGTGTCVNTGATDCHPFMCQGDSCRTNCSIDDDCVSGYNCVSPNCCLPISTGSGSGCGGGDLFSFTHSNTSPTGTVISGNLVGASERWYRFRAVEWGGDLNIWSWLSTNPSSEFRIEVRETLYAVTNCTGATAPDDCDPDPVRYQWYHSGCSVNGCQDNDSQTIYVRVYRSVTATPTCNSYQLTIKVGGTVQPW